MFKITGARRTSERFLDKIQRMSMGGGIEDVVEKLRGLKIFSAVTKTKDGVSVTEEKRSISFGGDTTRSVPRGYLRLRFPNMFGRAENLELSLSTSKDVSLKFTKPVFVFHRSLAFLSVFGSRDLMKSPHEEYPHVRISLEAEREGQRVCAGREKIGYLDQAFLEVRQRLSVFDIKGKLGMFDSRSCRAFLKTQVGMAVERVFRHGLFTDLHVATGAILGEPHIAERYYLGENIKGYKDMSISPSNCGLKIGGSSFLEMSHRVGFCGWDAKAFGFWSLGYVSEGKDIANGIKSAIQSGSYRDIECFGASVGIGATVPVMRSKDGPVVAVSFAVPMTNNRQVQRLQFGFDMDF